MVFLEGFEPIRVQGYFGMIRADQLSNASRVLVEERARVTVLVRFTAEGLLTDNERS